MLLVYLFGNSIKEKETKTVLKQVNVKSIYKMSIIAFVTCAQFAGMSFAQKYNPTMWPYGGVPDSIAYLELGGPPLNFQKAVFEYAHFDSVANFIWAHFDSVVNFRDAEFDTASFEYATIPNRFLLGSQKAKTFDFRWTIFPEYAKLELHDIVSFKMQQWGWSIEPFG